MRNLFNSRAKTLLATSLLFTIITTSCRKENNFAPVVEAGNANIRITNTVLGSASQDFYQGDLKLSVAPIAYGEFTPYLKVKAGNTSISLKDANSTTIKASENVGLATDASYTAFYYSTGSGSGGITGYQDDNNAPAAGKVKVRFVNLGPAFNNTLNVSITGGASLFTGLAFDKPSPYTSIDPNTALDVTVLGSGNTLKVDGANFIAGKNYTVWFDAATSTTVKFHVITQN